MINTINKPKTLGWNNVLMRFVWKLDVAVLPGWPALARGTLEFTAGPIVPGG